MLTTPEPQPPLHYASPCIPPPTTLGINQASLSMATASPAPSPAPFSLTLPPQLTLRLRDNHSPYKKSKDVHHSSCITGGFLTTPTKNGGHPHITSSTIRVFDLLGLQQPLSQYVDELLETSTITQALLTPTHQGSAREGG